MRLFSIKWLGAALFFSCSLSMAAGSAPLFHAAQELFDFLAKEKLEPTGTDAIAFQRSLLGILGAEAELVEHENPKASITVSNAPGTNTAILKCKSISELDGQDALAPLKEAAQNAAAILVDLRDTSGDDTDAASEIAAFIQGLNRPVAVLVNKKTACAAESLALELKNAKSLLLGEPTAGRKGARRVARLSSGAVIRIQNVITQPISPDISLAYEKNTMLWTQIAADTLTVLRLSGGLE